jgi:hypothetical protein
VNTVATLKGSGSARVSRAPRLGMFRGTSRSRSVLHAGTRLLGS